MDYLDPKKRRAYHIRLLLGYVLVAIVIGLGTVIIVYGANGYGINTKTGEILQNGLVFVDSNPGGAEIFLNGNDRNATTSSRLVLPAGTYTLSLKKDGYRDWSRKFVLSEESVARYVYPFLFPKTPQITAQKTYSSAPRLVTQSPNQRWLLAQDSQASTQAPVFDEYDTTTLDQQVPVVSQVSIPAGIMTNYSASSQLTEVEWSTDNNNVLLKHAYSGGNEYIVFNRDQPSLSYNVNKVFNVAPDQASLFNKKADQLYIFTQQDGVLRLGDVESHTLNAPILKGVLAYKPYGKNLITYVTANGAAPSMVAAKIWENGSSFKLNEFTIGTKYLIDAAEFQGHFYFVAGSDTSQRINIYKDPLNTLKDTSVGKALPLLALRVPGAQKLGFSNNTRFIGAENGQQFSVYDIETNNIHPYTIDQPLADNMSWMDGHRYIGVSNGSVFVMDYDGTNRQLITPTDLPAGALFSANYKHMLTLATAPDGSGVVLQDLDMRAGTDLPKK